VRQSLVREQILTAKTRRRSELNVLKAREAEAADEALGDRAPAFEGDTAATFD
jgi:hypothetical protein